MTDAEMIAVLLDAMGNVGLPAVVALLAFWLRHVVQRDVELGPEPWFADQAARRKHLENESLGKTASRARAEELIAEAEAFSGRDIWPPELGIVVVQCRSASPIWRTYVIQGILIGEFLNTTNREKAIRFVHELLLKEESVRLKQEIRRSSSKLPQSSEEAT